MKTLFLMAGVAALIGVPRANATIEIRLINTAGSGDTGWVTNPGNVITFNGVVGNYTVNISTGLNLGSLGLNPFLDLNSIDATTGGTSPGTLLIETIANGYTISSPQFGLEVGGTSSLGGTDTFTAYGGNNNGFCPAGTNTCSPTSLSLTNLASLSFNSSPFSGSQFSAVGSASPYSLAIAASIAGVNAGSASFDSALNAVPEPASGALLGGVLLVSVRAIRRRAQARRA